MNRLATYAWDAFPAIRWGGRPGGSKSEYSDRRRNAAETIAAMHGMLHEFGVTRIARVTGLDCVGIPVWTAIRPNAKTVSQSQGKGLNDEAAQASAMMEAIEVATAERADLRSIRATRRSLISQGIDARTFDGFLREGAKKIEDDDIVQWAQGFDLISDRSVIVPLQLVTLSDAAETPRYWQATDGLASGNDLWEAVVHGLCERVERDAIALWRLRTDQDVEARCVAVESFCDPALDDLALKIANAGLQLRLFDATCDSGVPVFAAFISPEADGSEHLWEHIDLSGGYGCHPRPYRAAIRAVTEAAQSRLTTISGARDFHRPTMYKMKLDPSLLIYARAEPLLASGLLKDAEIEPEDYVRSMLGRLKGIGVRSVVVVPLENGARGFSVAKILVEDLESPAGPRKTRFGPRAHAFARSRQ